MSHAPEDYILQVLSNFLRLPFCVRWPSAHLLPGAERILVHLHAKGIPVALATSSSRASLQRKLSEGNKRRILEFFQAVTCGDEVAEGKPAPDAFR